MAEDILANIEISPREVKDLLDRGAKFLFVDVREKWEFETSRIEGSTLVPLREVPENLARFEGAEEIVLYCHHGIRSFDAAAWLRSQGVEGARSMAGGIDRWSVEVDPNVPRY
ncbi:MAG TPA: rhodanese-like domain-containing protein [Candidatus Acidoferrales bacterium]|jgi:rhodanese-related sulfurtransferase|nr:rhodanese-like domain-containing protein [Candidatus Acidoferrales bacterium]